MSDPTPNGVLHPDASEALRLAAAIAHAEMRATGRSYSAEEILFTGIIRGIVYTLAGGIEYAAGMLFSAGVTQDQFARRLEACRAFVFEHPVGMLFARGEGIDLDGLLPDPLVTDALPESPGATTTVRRRSERPQ